MRKRNIIFLAAAVAILAAVPFVYAGARAHLAGGRGFGHGMGMGMGMHHGFGGDMLVGHLAHLKDELDLSDAQTDQIKAIFNETREQNAQYRQQLHGTYKTVAQTLLANPANVAQAQALLDQQASAERAMKANLVNSAAKALAVLTPEQREKLATKFASHLEQWENRGR